MVKLMDIINILDNNTVEVNFKEYKLKQYEYKIVKFLAENKNKRVPCFMLVSEVLPFSSVEQLNYRIIPEINNKLGNIILETRIGNCYYIEQ